MCPYKDTTMLHRLFLVVFALFCLLLYNVCPTNEIKMIFRYIYMSIRQCVALPRCVFYPHMKCVSPPVEGSMTACLIKQGFLSEAEEEEEVAVDMSEKCQ